MKRRGWIWVSLLLLLAGKPAFGSERQFVDYQSNLREIQRIQAAYRDSREVSGEILGIDRKEVILRTAGGIRRYPLASRLQCYSNGRAALWEALQPVTPSAFYEAQALLDAKNEVVLLNGFYDGGEFVVKGRANASGGYRVTLEPVEGGKTATYGFSPQAALPPGEEWLAEGQILFVLFNFDHAIRAVYLPDA
ncbi:hypothetical protein EDC14_10299 [Hydrogenispora ethanolica]|jgi:hypothetical protein|uniref:Uncharacterized protein n=1 Tax=Hydrogenispora ethanolica TaxID=1082276 RepID=A0A4R1R8U3_HYDET|nr:hypothetical protein [Hydrogenispora ethanolica]TCL61980.1 hypothetical protein EDC14_10299 [Hydrogenispora ethanolica]